MEWNRAMTTWTALTTLEGEEAAEALGAAMEERLDPPPVGLGVFEIEDGSGRWEVGGYFTERPDEAALALLAAAFGASPFAVSELPDQDWVAKVRRELAPVRAGRFFIHGSHDADRVPEGVIPILVDAAMAFGTGHHGTTRGCLLAFEALIGAGVAPRRLADVGCGTALLAIAAARALDRPVLAGDIDPVAVETAAANAARNGVADKVRVVEAAGFDHPAFADAGPFDLVFANILKGPLLALAPDMARHVAPDGHVILSGILVEQAEEVEATYEAAGFVPAAVSEPRLSLGEWTTLTLRRAG